jgi:hypothetical protein
MQQVPGVMTVSSFSDDEGVGHAEREKNASRPKGFSPAVTVNEKAGY